MSGAVSLACLAVLGDEVNTLLDRSLELGDAGLEELLLVRGELAESHVLGHTVGAEDQRSGEVGALGDIRGDVGALDDALLAVHGLDDGVGEASGGVGH